MDFNLRLSHLTSWKGDITRTQYLVWGLALFAVKYNLDRYIALWWDKSWFITDYVFQADELSVSGLSPGNRNFFLILLLQSLPFIWFGTVLCVKRLRNAGLHGWLVVFFFIPFVNFILFIILSIIPEKAIETATKTDYIGRLIPRSKYGSAMFAVAIVSVVSLLIAALLINYLESYGWSLFVGIPFFLGFGSVLLYGFHRQLQYREALGVSLAATLLFGLIIFILAFEGIICIAMAFPIFIVVAAIGASVGYAIHAGRPRAVTPAFVTPILFISLAGFIEEARIIGPPSVSVETSIVVNAPKQKVWDQLVAFSEIKESPGLLFQTGIAYPIHAEIEGTGVGAVRKCNFTTGPFIEPITVWNEPDMLEFGVLDQPPPMVEWSIYRDLKIPHLDGYFRSEKGRFTLQQLSNGQTLLIGTTWYHHDIWPSIYWKQWSDFILHRIHTRVLVHIKQESERA